MAYVYEGNNYRGGATGVENDFALRQYFAQQAANSLSGLTPEQLERALGELEGPQAAYRYLMDNGIYSPAEQSAITSSRVQEINNTTRAMQQNYNNMLASRGLGGNAGASAAMSMAGQFAGAGERGRARADVIQANKQSQLAGLEGYTGIARNMADLRTGTATPDQAGQYMDIYNQWRNAQVGYDGAKWRESEPEAEDESKKNKKTYSYLSTGGF